MSSNLFINNSTASNVNNVSNQELQKKFEENQNFAALDKEKLKQDTLELKNKTQEKVKENWIYRTLRNVFGVEDPKKLMKSVGLTLGTVVGLAVLGNKSSDFMAQQGLKVDKVLSDSNNILGKTYGAIAGFFKKGKNTLVNAAKKTKIGQELAQALTTDKAKPKLNLARGTGQGFETIFAMTPVDVIEKAFKESGIKDVNSAKNILQHLVGDKAEEIANQILGSNVENKLDNKELCKLITDGIYEKFNCQSKQDLLDVLLAIKKGEKGKELKNFINVDMKDTGLSRIQSSWWPVNIVNTIGQKLGLIKSEKGFCRGNLGDALIKYNVVSGDLANTKVGSLVQKSLTVPTESVSNFVNDKSGFGAFLCIPIMNLYNNVQDAPTKKQKVATVADDYISTLGSFAISMPLSFATTYGLASLKNLKGETLATKALKQVGKFFGMGLDKVSNGVALNSGNKLTKLFGGVLRFALVMFVFSPKFSKPIQGAIHKVFGKPYNKEEEEQKKQLEAQKNTVIPELGITQGELMDKIQKNPKALENLQNNQESLALIQKNPKLLLDLLDGKDITKTQVNTQANTQTKVNNQTQANNQVQLKPQNQQRTISSLNQNLISRKKENTLNNTKESTNSTQTPTNNTNSIDSATYIPSSDFVASSSTLTQEQQKEYNDMMSNADKALKNAEKYI